MVFTHVLIMKVQFNDTTITLSSVSDKFDDRRIEKRSYFLWIKERNVTIIPSAALTVRKPSGNWP